jgi:CubicO group peptidase (beta-lactamase class C family)
MDAMFGWTWSLYLCSFKYLDAAALPCISLPTTYQGFLGIAKHTTPTMLLETEAFSRLVQDKMREMSIPGLSIAVVDGDDIHSKVTTSSPPIHFPHADHHAQNFGHAQLDGNPCTSETLFDVASTSKSFTAAAVALLVEDPTYPAVQWTTPVSQLLPDDFILSDPTYTAQVTVEDILSHRTGLPAHEQSFLGAQSPHHDTARSVTRNLRNLPLTKPIRSEYMYSNMLFTVATHLVESVSGEAYADFVKKRLWDPLEMANTHHDIPAVDLAHARDHLATGYRWDVPTARNAGVAAYAQPEAQGAGLVYSSASDMAKWVRAMVHHSPPLSATSHDALVAPRTIIRDVEDEIPFSTKPLYALGWMAEAYRGHALVGHSGGFTGFATVMRWAPGKAWGVVVCGNADSAWCVNEMVFYLLFDEKIGVSAGERVDWAGYWTEAYEKGRREEAEALEALAALEVREGNVAAEKMVGEYHNAGYHTLKLELREGMLRADCADRCMPFELTFYPAGGKKMDVKMHWTVDGATKRVNGEVRVDEQGEVVAIGVGFVDEDEDYLIWFDKVS